MKNFKILFDKLQYTDFWKYCCLFVLLAVAYCNFNNESQKFPDRIYGRPVVSTEFPQINLSVEQVLEYNDHIYVLHHHSYGIVQVYDFSGRYQFTIFFYCHMNGGFALAVDKEILYVQDKNANIYVFSNGEFVRFMERAVAKTELRHISFKPLVSSKNYVIKGNSVWRVLDNKEICIIDKQSKTSKYANSLLFVMCLPLMITIYFLRQKQKRYKTSDGSQS